MTGALQGAAFEIRAATSAEELAAVARLFRDYAASLDIDLSYQDFEAELASLPGRYAPPEGRLLLALNARGVPAGCAAFRPVAPEGCCEMKRLYVVPAARGTGLGRLLAEALIAAAEEAGYREMRLDTLPSMAGAQALYGRLGFAPMDAYYETPVADTVFLRRTLHPLRAT